jgi:hypothetical protein
MTARLAAVDTGALVAGFLVIRAAAINRFAAAVGRPA